MAGKKRNTMKRRTIRRRDMDEELHACRFPSGLPAYLLPKPGFVKSFAILATRYGSIDVEIDDPVSGRRRKIPPGVAHFLEHQQFEMEHGNASEIYARLGSNVNAYTSYSTTAYFFTATRRFTESLELLLEFVLKSHFTRESVERERGIIESELRGYEDSAGWRGFYNMTRALYLKHPVKIDAGGSVGSIKKITRQLLSRCHELFYHPGNMVLVVCGDLRPDKIFRQVGNFLKRLSPPPFRPVKRYFPKEPKRVARKRITEKLDVAHPRLLLGFKDNAANLTGKKLARKVVEVRMALDLLFNRSAPAYSAFYETGLIDDSFSSGFDLDVGFGYAYLSGNTHSPGELQKRILDVIKKARRSGFSNKDFKRVKSKLLGHSIRYFNSVESTANWLFANALIGITHFDYLDELEKVTRAGVQRTFRQLFQPSASAASIILPRK
ncbi:MAG: insulinase family protein [Planctomycetota bacterium]|nr:MAG: insulinase family protein [Planctomycetota bacterium]